MSWSTTDEVSFIRTLSHDTLVGYKKSLQRRQDWGSVDADYVKSFVESRLLQEPPPPYQTKENP